MRKASLRSGSDYISFVPAHTHSTGVLMRSLWRLAESKIHSVCKNKANVITAHQNVWTSKLSIKRSC